MRRRGKRSLSFFFQLGFFPVKYVSNVRFVTNKGGEGNFPSREEETLRPRFYSNNLSINNTNTT